jgi:hypothetical protein
MASGKTEFPEHARPDNPDGYLVVQRNLEFLRDEFDQTVHSAAIVTGAKGGNVALTNLLLALQQLGIIKDNTT